MEGSEAVDATILVVDDEPSILTSLSRLLAVEGYRTLTASSGEAALSLLARNPVDLVILDVLMPGGMSGLDALDRMHAEATDAGAMPAVIMMSGHSTVEIAVQAIQAGARDFIEKPLSTEKILITVNNSLRIGELERQNAALRSGVVDRYRLVGDAPAMSTVYERIRRAAPTQGSVLVTGESGTGKELVARAIHAQSRRASEAFIKLNCAAIPADLIESELFGHEKGAFTGATSAKKGKFETAHRGSLFLDEIGDMHLDAQAKLLRVLQEGELERVGGTTTHRVDVRVVAATNKDLEVEIQEGRFRDDLYWRINVIPIHLPPLRDRRSDVASLVEHFISTVSADNGRQAPVIAPEAMAALQKHDWPGNVRQLRNVVERLVILGPTDRIGEDDVLDLGFGRRLSTAAGWIPDVPYRELIANAERAILRAALEAHEGHMTNTAAALHLERSHLYKKLKALGIKG